MLANTLNSRMYSQERVAPTYKSIRREEKRSRKLLRAYSELVRLLLKEYVTDHVLAEYDVAVLYYVQLPNLTLLQFADSLIANSCMITNLYDESTFEMLLLKAMTHFVATDCAATRPQTLKRGLANIVLNQNLYYIYKKDWKTP